MTDISERRYDILQWPQCTIWRSVLYDYVRQFLDKGDCWVLMLRLALGALWLGAVIYPENEEEVVLMHCLALGAL